MRKIAAYSVMLLLIAGAIWFSTGPASASSVAAQWFLIGLASTSLALWAWIGVKPNSSTIGENIQTLSAIFTIIAVFVAAGIYFLERRDRARLSFGLETSAVRPILGAQHPDSVLLTIRVPVENKGERRVKIDCLAIDVQHPAPGVSLARSSWTREEMQLVRLGEQIPYETTPEVRGCLVADAIRLRAQAALVRPLFMWRPMELEPSEADDRYFEVPVSCTYPFVRVLLKIRITAEDERVYETKTIVPLADICRGQTESTGGVSSPTLGTGDDATTAREAAPSAG